MTRRFGPLPLMAFPAAWYGDKPEPPSLPVESEPAPETPLPISDDEFLRFSGVEPGPVDEVF